MPEAASPKTPSVEPGLNPNQPSHRIRGVLAAPRTEQEERCQGARRPDQVDHGGAGEVLHADIHLEPAAAEDPVADDRVEQGAEHDRVDHVGAELDPLEGRSPDDCEGDGAERELEEQERRRVDAVRPDERNRVAGLSGRRAEVEEEPGVTPELSRPTEREREAHRPVAN
jgi:hypothetical protein